MSQSLKVLAESVEAAPFEIPGATGGTFRIQILNEDRDRGVVTTLVHLPPGGRIPAHRHGAGSEMHYVLEGDMVEAGETLGPGAFLTHAAGQVHGPHESRGGAKVLTVQTWQSEGGSFDFQPVEGGGAAPGGAPSGGGASGGGGGTTARPGTDTAGGPPAASNANPDNDGMSPVDDSALADHDRASGGYT